MILVLLDHFYVCGWIFLLCSVSEDVMKCPRSKVVGSRGWIVYVQMKTGTFCVWRTSHSRFGFHSFSSCFGSWLWGCKDTTFNGWEQPPSCWPPLHFTLYLELSIVSSCQGLGLCSGEQVTGCLEHVRLEEVVNAIGTNIQLQIVFAMGRNPWNSLLSREKWEHGSRSRFRWGCCQRPLWASGMESHLGGPSWHSSHRMWRGKNWRKRVST